MPRAGRHPLKSQDYFDVAQLHKRLTVTTVVYIPMLSGYWQEGFSVLKLFFQSLRENTPEPYDLMVFDNGSCQEVQDYLLELRRKGQIQYLIFSEYNLRKFGALNYLLTTAPGEFVAYADSDVYFLPGWWENSLQVLETFPEVGKVTALPILMDSSSPAFERVFHFAFESARQNATIDIQTGALIPEEYVNAHRVSLGENPGDYLRTFTQRQEIALQRGNSRVLLSGADFQFTIRRAALQKILPLNVESPSEKGDSIYSPVLEMRLAQAGFWQVSTPGYYVHHMGNHVPDLGRELPWLANAPTGNPTAPAPQPTPARSKGWVSRVLKSALVRNILKKIHLASYRLLYE